MRELKTTFWKNKRFEFAIVNDTPDYATIRIVDRLGHVEEHFDSNVYDINVERHLLDMIIVVGEFEEQNFVDVYANYLQYYDKKANEHKIMRRPYISKEEIAAILNNPNCELVLYNIEELTDIKELEDVPKTTAEKYFAIIRAIDNGEKPAFKL